jgi:hypothetical protein
MFDSSERFRIHPAPLGSDGAAILQGTEELSTAAKETISELSPC